MNYKYWKNKYKVTEAVCVVAVKVETKLGLCTFANFFNLWIILQKLKKRAKGVESKKQEY